MSRAERHCAHTLLPLHAGQGVCVLRGPNDQWIIDFSEKLSAESAVLQADEKILHDYLSSHGMTAETWAGWWPRQQHLANKRLLEWLALVRKSGALIHGYAKVLEALQAQQLVAIVQANDGGRDAEKISQPALKQGLPVIRLWDAQTLGQPVGREHAVHIGLKAALMSEKFLAECSRLAGFLKVDGL